MTLLRFAISVALCLAALPLLAQDAGSFADKSITMIISSGPGGGADITGRLVARFLEKYLPGQPNIIVQNEPGAGGITALNNMVKQTVPDGMTIVFASNGVVDPFNYRKPQSMYTPANFTYLGGISRGGEFLLIGKKALSRLYDKTKPPVIMGSIGGVPRSGMQMAAWCIEFLACNVKWVVGYRTTDDLMLALQRGEIDMTATGNSFEVEKLVHEGGFSIAMQSGTLRDGILVPRPEFADAPMFATQIQRRISDRVAQQAFDYWFAINIMDKWLGILSGTSPTVTQAYRQAFAKLAKDGGFLAEGRKVVSQDFSPMSYDEVDTLIKKLAATTPEAVGYMTGLLRKQGLQVAN